MTARDTERSAERAARAAQGSLAPGALSALLDDLARMPEANLGEGWTAGLRPGAVVGRFELLREIGRGGFGVVYEARDRELGRTVAFKAVRAGDRAALREERLLREAETAARLSHPNIVALHDVGHCPFGPYLVLELLRGQTLAARLEQGPLPVRETLRIAILAAQGLAHAHAQGVVHRDLTPGNLFLCDDGQVKVLDFGLAHAFGQRHPGGGTPSYMAPEQWRGAPEDERTDVFALGVILHRMLAGALPFPEDDGGKALAGSRPAPALEVPDVPALGGLVARMLAKDPVARPRDAGQVLAALTTFQRELDRTPSAPSAPVQTRARGRRWVGLGAGAAALLVLAAGAWMWRRAGSPEPPGGRITVAVADFANQTGEPELNGLSGMLITSLEQSRRLSVLTRVRMLDVLRQLGKEQVAGVDEALGREVARAAGARALVLASIHRFDQLYAIELQVLDPASSEYLFTLKEQGRGKASVPGMLDRLSEQTRARLRESRADVEASRVRVADATTASFEAWQHYFRGEQLKDATRYPEALEEYRQAYAADPTFALAHYQIAYLGEFTMLDEATRRAEMEEALRQVARVPEKERLLFRAWKAHMDGHNDEAHRLYAEAAERFPQDKEALYLAGDLYLHAGAFAEALPRFEQALALDPGWEPALMHFTDCLAALGRDQELLQKSRWWVEKAPGGSSYRALAHALVGAGRWGEAVEAARRAFDLDGASVFSRVGLAEVLLLAERYAEAEALLRPLAGPEAPEGDRIKVLPQLASAVAYQGRRREALRLVDAVPAGGAHQGPGQALLRLQHLLGDRSPEAALREARALAAAGDPNPRLAAVLALAGDVALATAQAARLPAGPEKELAEAAIACRRGDAEVARSRLAELARRPAPDMRALLAWLQAGLALDGHRDAEAVEALQRLQALPGGPWRSWAYPRSFYLEAAAAERLGDRPRARQRIDHLLGLWKQPDADLPYLAEARALRQRLAEGRAP